MSNRDYLYTRDMIDSGRTAELTAGERAREAADIARDEAKESGVPLNQQLINAGKASGHAIALTQVIAEMHKLVDEPWCTDEHKLLLSMLLTRIRGLKP